jgi:hypothetical protein
MQFDKVLLTHCTAALEMAAIHRESVPATK